MSLLLRVGPTAWNTHYAPLAALGEIYRQWELLSPLSLLSTSSHPRRYTPADKFTQLLVSMLADCRVVSQVNSRLRPELALAACWGWPAFADQSTLARSLDSLSQSNLADLRAATHQIWRRVAASRDHDWRALLRLEVDLSGLPASKRAEGSEKGYFSGKKTPPAANWSVSARSSTQKRSSRSWSPVVAPAANACSSRCGG